MKLYLPLELEQPDKLLTIENKQQFPITEKLMGSIGILGY